MSNVRILAVLAVFLPLSAHARDCETYNEIIKGTDFEPCLEDPLYKHDPRTCLNFQRYVLPSDMRFVQISIWQIIENGCDSNTTGRSCERLGSALTDAKQTFTQNYDIWFDYACPQNGQCIDTRDIHPEIVYWMNIEEEDICDCDNTDCDFLRETIEQTMDEIDRFVSGIEARDDFYSLLEQWN